MAGCLTGLANEPLGWWWLAWVGLVPLWQRVLGGMSLRQTALVGVVWRSEEHTSELQSLTNLVCRLLLEKKKQKNKNKTHNKDTSS